MRLFLLLCLSIGWAMPALSSDMAGTLTAKGVTWQSAQHTAEGVVPAIWDVPLSLPAAEKVIPGGPASTAEQSFTLSGPGGTVSVPVTISGLSYRLSSNIGVADTSGSKATISEASAVVNGAGTGNKVVTLSSLSSPFTHYRPILKADTTDTWLARFKAAGLSTGTYQGVINYLVPYNYYRNGVLVRNTLQGSLAVKLAYKPAQLSAINVSGDGIIMPQYYGYPERLVGGTTDYVIHATGVFPNGVHIGLKALSGHANRYQLVSQSTTSSPTSIDYSVQCSVGCEGGNQIITNGVPDINSTTRRISMGETNSTSARATITVSFANKKLTELNSDTYLGEFILIFEAGI